MRREITAGIIVYRKTQDGPKFLILYHGGSYWNFPKGHIESEEKSMAAALRETKEETGIPASALKIAPGFKTYERFYFKRGSQPTFKIVIFYLAETRARDVRISFEHQGFGWFLFKDAEKILKFPESQRSLKQAYDFLRGRARRRAGP